MVRTLLALFLALTLTLPLPAALAQGSSWKHVRRVTRPLLDAELDLATGRYSVGARPRPKAATFNTRTTLSNLDFSGFIGVDSVQCEWFDSAVKGDARTGGASEILTSFRVAYCSDALDTSSGGVGGSATISFVEGYATPAVGAPAPAFASRTAVFNLSGLPASTTQYSFGWRCWLLHVRVASPSPGPASSFTGGLPLADGPIGWSWDFRDISPVYGPPLAATIPFLTCVTSCSGAGPDGQAMTDGIDQYCGRYPNAPPFTLLASFTFDTAQTFTAMSLELREAEAVPFADALYNPAGGAPPNPVILTNVAPPVLGASLVNALDCSAASVSAPAIFRYEFRPGFVAPFQVGAAAGNVLVSLVGSYGKNLVVPSHGAGTVAPAVPLPLDLAFLGSAYQVQGFCGDAPRGFLSNARNQTVGSE